ncbi:MAG: efflux RND transporter periplasmic adaptor subunit, partial [Alcanivoracaceae bacterium]|nr:efflux RND transporter periplasmic adaptor subunit [Alcanivoracaceae bacterium]
EKGQPLYDIYSPSLVNAQEELVLALNNNNKRLINAAKERLKSLQLPKSAIAKLMKSKKIQQNITFYSPQSGYVDKLEIRQGFFVKPGKTLMQIGNLEQVWVIAEVVESDISHISINLPVTMKTDALPTRSWHGAVDYIYPTLNAKNRTIKVRIRFDNPENLLKPNMFAAVQIHHNENDELLLVPKEAVIRTGKSNRVVLALGEGQFKSIIVETGRQDDDYFEILSGIHEGEMVVTSAQFLLDSESSKTSDFKRMNHGDEMTEMTEMTEMDEPPKATVIGIIQSMMKDHGMLNIDREAIEDWGRPAANVDFITNNSVDISQLENGDKVFFTFIIEGGDFVITEIDKLSTL